MAPFADLRDEDLRSVAARCLPKEDTIAINPLARYWRNADVLAREAYDMGFWSTPDPRGQLYHEVGHSAHYRSGVDIFALVEWPPGPVEVLDGKASDYAMAGSD